MMRLEPIDPWLIALIAVASLLALTWLSRRSHSQLPARLRPLLLGLRIAMVALILTVLLNPVWLRQSPDERAYTVAVLGQNSPSMLVEDVEGQSRLDWLQAELDRDGDDNLWQRLSENHPLSAFSFVEQIRPLDGPLQLQSGTTAIGESLQQLLDRPAPAGGEWGAVLLLSDGVQREGLSPISVARRYAEAGIPVHVIGVGDRTSTGDLRVHFRQRELEGVRGQPMELAVTVENLFGSHQRFDLQLWEEDEAIETRSVELAPGEVRNEVFEAEPARGGFRTYRVEIDSDTRPRNPATDRDYATARIEDPATHRVLYLGRPNWEHRFLRILLDTEDRFELKAWLQLGPDRFARRGFEDGDSARTVDSFPEDGQVLESIDTVLLDGGIFAKLPEATRSALIDFVSRGGGGLLLTGAVPDELEELEALLPARQLRSTRFRDNRSLQPIAGPLLRDEDQSIYTRSPAIFHSQAGRVWIPSRIPRGARVALETQDGEPLLLYHAYGAGRVAYQGSEEFWRWRMESSAGSEQHRRYWLTVLSWLSESRQPRLTTPLQGQVRTLGDTAPLQIRALDNAFRPRADARVRARITKPDGEQIEHSLLPRFGEPGIYDADLELGQVGEYRVRYQVDFADGQQLEREIFFATVSGDDQRDNALDEALLRDIARLSGGQYWDSRAAESLRRLPLSSSVPMIENPIYWARTLPFISLILALAAADWYLRRRFGLK